MNANSPKESFPHFYKPLFAVISKDGNYLGLVTDRFAPRGGVLMSGHVIPAIFTKRWQAQKAIARTKQFALQNNYAWDVGKIVRMIPEGFYD